MRQVVLPFVSLCCPQHARRLGTIHAYSSMADYDHLQQKKELGTAERLNFLSYYQEIQACSKLRGNKTLGASYHAFCPKPVSASN